MPVPASGRVDGGDASAEPAHGRRPGRDAGSGAGRVPSWSLLARLGRRLSDLEDLDAAMAAGRGATAASAIRACTGWRRRSSPWRVRLPEPPVCRVTSSGQAALLLALSTWSGRDAAGGPPRPCYGAARA